MIRSKDYDMGEGTLQDVLSANYTNAYLFVTLVEN